MTGRPSIASNRPSKSSCWSGSSSASASRRASSSSAMIIARIFGWRSSAMNMCSVRHRPMPSAPSSRALRRVLRRVGVGAHAEPAELVGPLEHACRSTRRPRASTAGRPRASRSPWCRRWRCSRPRRSSCRRREIVRASRSIFSALGADHARAGPCRAPPARRARPCRPRLVRMPLAAWKPATSSASVNGRTRITSRPVLRRPATASRGGEHDLALGGARRGARRPWRAPRSRPWGRRSGAAARRASSASIVMSASSRVSSPSSTASHAKRTAAWAGRLALRVWSMYSCPSSTVNSVSCMSS